MKISTEPTNRAGIPWGVAPWPPYVSGNYYELQSTWGGSASDSSTAVTANRFVIVPFWCHRSVTIDLIGQEVVAGVASAQMKMVVYESDGTSGLPTTLMLETANIDCATNGFKSIACSESFVAGRLYWMGARYDSTQTMRMLTAGNAAGAMGLSATINSNRTIVGLSDPLTYATAAPDPGTVDFSWTDGLSGNTPFERPMFRVA